MSYILEALKKVDRERGIGAVPDLATPHEPKRPRTRSHRWLWIIVMLLSVNAVLVFMSLTDRDAEDGKAPVSVQGQAEPQPSLTDDPSMQPIQQTAEPPIGGVPTPEKPVVPGNEQTPSVGGLVVLPDPADLQNPGASILSEEASNMRIDAMSTAKDNSQLQSWYELPQEIRNRIDLPRLDVHVYSEDPQKRFIMVNLEKYREGERLAGGLVLEEILPGGMVMSYQGERFRVEE